MGRTIHSEIINSKALTDNEKKLIYEISKLYNSGVFEDVWTGENFFMNPVGWYPNWNKFGGCGNPDVEKIYDKIYKMIEERTVTGNHIFNIIMGLVQEGIVCLYNTDRTISTHTKVGSNEFNALLIYKILITISLMTASVIEVHDEGEFLITHLIIKDGKVKINIKETYEQWAYWKKRGFIIEGNEHFNEEVYRDYQIQENLISLYDEEWIEPSKLCRKVNPDDFIGHPEYDSKQVMAGFDGEYWGLTSKDTELESLKAVAYMQQIVSKTSKSDSNVELKIAQSITTKTVTESGDVVQEEKEPVYSYENIDVNVNMRPIDKPFYDYINVPRLKEKAVEIINKYSKNIVKLKIRGAMKGISMTFNDISITVKESYKIGSSKTQKEYLIHRESFPDYSLDSRDFSIVSIEIIK